MTPGEICRLPARKALAPQFPAESLHLANRRTMALVFESDAAAIRGTLPEPLTPLPSNRVIHAWSRLPGIAGLRDSFETRLVIPCRLGGLPCHFVANHRRGEMAPRGAGDADSPADLELRRRLAPRPPIMLEATLNRLQCALKLLADVDGAPAIAQLIGMCPANVTVKQWWSSGGNLPDHPGLEFDGPVLPLRRLAAVHFYIADMTLQAGRRLVDYLRPGSARRARAA